METVLVNYSSKVRLLLEKLLQAKCDVQNDEYLKKLLIHLWWEEKRDVDSILPIFSEWIVSAVTTWSAAGVTPPTNVVWFTLSLVGLLIENEDRFNSLNSHNFFIKLVNVTKARELEVPSSVKLAYIKLLSSFLEHKSGVEWMIACNYWEDVFQLSLTSENDDIVVESTNFMGKILEKTIDCDENFCDNVVKRIMLPLGENIYRCVKVSNSLTDEVAFDCLKPTLRLIANLLEYFMKGIYFEGKDFGVTLIFLKNFHLEERICDFMIIGQKKCLVFDVSRVMFVMQFLEMYGHTVTRTTTLTKINASVARIKNNFTLRLFREDFLEQIELCRFGLLYWKLIDLKLPAFRNDRTNPKGNHYSDQKISELEDECFSDVVKDIWFEKLMKMVSYDFLRVFFFWRPRLIDYPNISEICSISVNVLKESRTYLTRDQAVMAFQMLTYFLKDIIRIPAESPKVLDVFISESSYILQMLELTGILIEDYNISLKDAIESTYVIALCFDFLALTEWSLEMIVQVLKLINIAIGHYMSPNLALLVDDSSDIVAILGPLLYSKLLGKTSEVKKAALEVVCTAARICSDDKFPSLQKVLMDSELPTLVVKMSTCDGESFVRATAIKCLQEMIQVEEIWNNALKSEDLCQKMRDILLNETEGIVRVEAATFMCVAYEHQQFPKDTLDRIYETMIYSSTTDLHWEVKVRALGFWDKVIKNHLQNQGMIDGSFPNVTFSKEHRKIVTLTDSEIRKRLLKVLGQLSSIGCLGVLMSAIKDDCDMEVSKTAVKITQRLVDLFRKYNLRNDCSAPTSPLPTENGMSTTMSMSSGVSVDESMDSPASSHPDLNEEIIEQIVNSKDVSLLKNVYAPSDYGSVSNYDIQVRKIVTPNEFLQFTQQDLNNIIAEKKKWLNGIEDLGSLLDDMLKTYDDDVNNMDCY